MNTDQKPRHCLQCLRIGLQLDADGRCSTCRHMTPVALWRENHDNGARGAVRPWNVPPAHVKSLRQRMETYIGLMHVHDVQTIGNDFVVEVHEDVMAGERVERTTKFVTLQ